MEKDRNTARKAEDDLKDKISKEKEDRKEDVKDRKEEHEEYKDLNERTWEELLSMYAADLYNQKLTLHIVEEAVYESIRRMIASLGNLGGGYDDLMNKLEITNTDLGKHKDRVVRQDKDNDSRFVKIEKTAVDFR